MKPVQLHGSPPYTVAVLHGGPGGCGEVEPVARELALTRGVLEPMGQALSVEGQIQELRGLLEAHADLPVTLVGFSWGAWLAWMTAARFPSRIAKLVLVAGAPFEASYASRISQTRLSRLSPDERAEFAALTEAMERSGTAEADAAFARFAALLTKADAFAPLPEAGASITPCLEVFHHVWPQAAALRQSGELLAIARDITCPVTAIHGDYDPHPAEGVNQPLSHMLHDFQFILLKRCGHRPWIEQHARDAFFQSLQTVLSTKIPNIS